MAQNCYVMPFGLKRLLFRHSLRETEENHEVSPLGVRGSERKSPECKLAATTTFLFAGVERILRQGVSAKYWCVGEKSYVIQ
jgi:hypothetical protein